MARFTASLLFALVLLAACLSALALWLLSPRPGEWSTPVRVGPWQAAVSVPSALRLLTAPAFAPWLDGRTLPTRFGPLRIEWQRAERRVQLHCAPCRLPVPALGQQPLQLARLSLDLHRMFDDLEGSVRIDLGAQDRPAIQASLRGQLTQQGLRLRLQMPATAIADAYAVLAPQLPELRQARIEGTVALRADWHLPAGRLRLRPEVVGFAVNGLGTERLARAGSSCGVPSRLQPDDWLVRAVLAAEDQRFYDHPGYDLRELRAALQANQAAAGVRRGASTLTQQLAKQLVTGDERSASRKLRELLYAVEMEQTLGKARILALYLDNAPWGAGICGAEAAARDYFQRSARRLAPAQAVWLAAMLHQPNAEARRWAQHGGIALPRAEWVARGLHAGMAPRERQALARALHSMAAP